VSRGGCDVVTGDYDHSSLPFRTQHCRIRAQTPELSEQGVGRLGEALIGDFFEYVVIVAESLRTAFLIMPLQARQHGR
jgi:hypothetical protein